MVKRIAAILVSLVLLFTPSTFASNKELVEQVKSAVALLYSQDEAGGMRMHCTVTAFEKLTTETVVNGKKFSATKGYLFATAAHCVGTDDVDKEKSADTKNIPFYITFDEAKAKTFYPAKALFVGYQHRGEDFSVFEVDTDADWGVMPLGDEKKASDGDDIINVSSPLGLGKQVLVGTISSVYLDRPLIEGDINWKGSITLTIGGVNGGSSGSAIVSQDQKAIVGFLVGTIGGTTVTAIPVSKFKAVRKAVEEGKYRYYSPTVDLNPDGSVK